MNNISNLKIEENTNSKAIAYMVGHMQPILMKWGQLAA
jgi:hypothetical protein